MVLSRTEYGHLMILDAFRSPFSIRKKETGVLANAVSTSELKDAATPYISEGAFYNYIKTLTEQGFIKRVPTEEARVYYKLELKGTHYKNQLRAKQGELMKQAGKNAKTKVLEAIEEFPVKDEFIPYGEFERYLNEDAKRSILHYSRALLGSHAVQNLTDDDTIEVQVKIKSKKK